MYDINKLPDNVKSPEVKNMLCGYYNYIIVNKLLDTYTLEEATRIAMHTKDGLGINFRVLDKFVEQIDLVKFLYENRPEQTRHVKVRVYNFDTEEYEENTVEEKYLSY